MQVTKAVGKQIKEQVASYKTQEQKKAFLFALLGYNTAPKCKTVTRTVWEASKGLRAKNESN